MVFTLPAEIAQIANQNKATVYGILFKAASETLLTIADDPKNLGVRIGITAVLHTESRSDAHCAAIVGDWEEPSGPDSN